VSRIPPLNEGEKFSAQAVMHLPIREAEPWELLIPSIRRE
jgi:hypothetical protein